MEFHFHCKDFNNELPLLIASLSEFIHLSEISTPFLAKLYLNEGLESRIIKKNLINLCLENNLSLIRTISC